MTFWTAEATMGLLPRPPPPPAGATLGECAPLAGSSTWELLQQQSSLPLSLSSSLLAAAPLPRLGQFTSLDGSSFK